MKTIETPVFNTMELQCVIGMGKTFSPYIKDDDLVEWIEDRADSDDYRNTSHVFQKAISKLRHSESDDVL